MASFADNSKKQIERRKEERPAVRPVQYDAIPATLCESPQWVFWWYEWRHDSWTKVPHYIYGPAENPTITEAKSNDSRTWMDFGTAHHVLVQIQERNRYGIGFMLADTDPFCVIDLDDCRDRTSGAITEPAQAIIDAFATYTEISPSGTGVKLFFRGKKPGPRCKTRDGSVEVYDRKRFVTLTGQRLAGTPATIEDRQAVLDRFYPEWFPAAATATATAAAAQTPDLPAGSPTPRPACSLAGLSERDRVIERARAYLARADGAISGRRGSSVTSNVARILVVRWGLSVCDALPLMREWNQRCSPPWAERELVRKLEWAEQLPGPRGDLVSESRPRPPSAIDAEIAGLGSIPIVWMCRGVEMRRSGPHGGEEAAGAAGAAGATPFPIGGDGAAAGVTAATAAGNGSTSGNGTSTASVSASADLTDDLTFRPEYLDSLNSDQLTEDQREATRLEVVERARLRLAAELQARRSRAASRCPCPRATIAIRHRTNGTRAVLRPACDQWHCSACGPYMLTRDISVASFHIRSADARGEQIALQLYESDDDWQNIYDQLRRRGALGFQVVHARSTNGHPAYLLIASFPADAKILGMGVKMSAAAAVDCLRAELNGWDEDYSPVVHRSHSWAVRQVTRSNQWERVGKAGCGCARPATILDIAEAAGCSANVSYPSQDTRIVLWASLTPPENATPDDLAYLDFMIQIGEAMSRSDYDFMRRMRRPTTAGAAAPEYADRESDWLSADSGAVEAESEYTREFGATFWG